MPNRKTETQESSRLKEISEARTQHAEEMQATFGAARLAQQELQGHSVSASEDVSSTVVPAEAVAGSVTASQGADVQEELVQEEPVQAESEVEASESQAADQDQEKVEASASAEPEVVTVPARAHGSRIAALARARMAGGGSAAAGKSTVRDVIASRTVGGVSASVKQAISDRLSKGRSAGKAKLPRVVG